MTMSREVYEELVLDHNRNPFHYMLAPEPLTHRGAGFNPSCGDELSVSLRIEDGVIREAGFEGVGCSISIAAASLMTRALEGLRVSEAEELFQGMTAYLHGNPVALRAGDRAMDQLAWIRPDAPDRIKCANLPWFILHAALHRDGRTVCTEPGGTP
ncbi:MAG: SUF system NifU family Fe-S cluster assembly protein [Magnetococcales bacterium]|nr:SUF system NifU family Fe-S cluster assembly protein [Magnetococcales bacterium]